MKKVVADIIEMFNSFVGNPYAIFPECNCFTFPFCEIADNFHARLEAREKRRAPAGHAGVVPLQRLRRRARERLQPREERARVSEHVYLVEETMPSLILFCHIWQHFSTFLIFGII